jgi:hypothetical protein
MSLIKVDQQKLAAIKEHETQMLRLSAYKEEADPLFFKAQRGEISRQVWLDKVAEIRNRFPDNPST